MLQDVDRQQLDFLAADLDWLEVPALFTTVDQEVSQSVPRMPKSFTIVNQGVDQL